MPSPQSDTAIHSLNVSAYTVPTASPEADGTYWWDKTTMVLVQAVAGGVRGLGYSYANVATAKLIDDSLKHVVIGKDAMAIRACWIAMMYEIRNLGQPGISSMAIAAVDNALWDLKARLLNASVAGLLGLARTEVPAYGSGGFTTYSLDELKSQLGGWADSGIKSVKMKIGTDPSRDLERVRAARDAIGPNTDLFVDANGAYSRKQALEKAQQFADYHVTWFEEPVSSDDLEGLRLMRDRAPDRMRIAAGEYGYDPRYFRRMLEAGAVDVLQADATRCQGITGFLTADALSDAFCLPLSAHTSPTLHTHACCGSLRAINVEYFFDHYRIEKMLLDGAIEAVDGMLRPDLSRPGFGIELKSKDAKQYQVYGSEG